MTRFLGCSWQGEEARCPPPAPPGTQRLLTAHHRSFAILSGLRTISMRWKRKRQIHGTSEWQDSRELPRTTLKQTDVQTVLPVGHQSWGPSSPGLCVAPTFSWIGGFMGDSDPQDSILLHLPPFHGVTAKYFHNNRMTAAFLYLGEKFLEE